jgi:16S rRNA (cytosine1402-N4)-methyltransferase
LISTEGRRNSYYHRPVMPDEVRRYLITCRDGIYLDMTCGGGGHIRILSESLSKKARLIGIDRDEEAISAARENLRAAPQLIQFVNSRFSEADRMTEEIRPGMITGILFDLGVSSHQIDSPERGFSFMADGPLDMRMDKKNPLSAQSVINDYTAEKLTEIFKLYAEEKKPSRLVSVIMEARQKDRIETTGQLRAILGLKYSGRDINSTLARLFQAIRIEVNGELDELAAVLPKAISWLGHDGRLVCISYHSLEDRIVKRFLNEKAKACICPDNFPVCVCGKKPEIKILTRRAIRPGPDEIKVNSRARSARLRAAQKII